MKNRAYYIQLFLTSVALLLIKSFYGQDTLKRLSLDEYMQIVTQYHPVVKQAQNNISISEAEILIAKSNFDPLLSNNFAQKTLNGTDYYTYNHANIQIPTWYGVDVFVGGERNVGQRLNDDQTLGNLSYVGVEIPLLKNLLYDKRRGAVEQARLFNELTINQKRVVINDIKINAIYQYLEWVQHYQLYLIAQNAVRINQQRLQQIKRTYELGERAAIDTLEALAQLQSFLYTQNEQWLLFQNAGLELSTYLWKSDNTTYILPSTVVPSANWDKVDLQNVKLVLDELISLAAKNHPELLNYNYKLSALEIDKKVKYQELLPKINLRYNQLGKDYNYLKTLTTGPLFENNYRFGVKFEMPLFRRQGRGEYNAVKLKLSNAALELANKKVQIIAKIKAYYNEYITLGNQIKLQEQNLANYQRLVKGEETKFFNGESSLFIINSRESKALEAQEKLVQLKIKQLKALYSLQWSAGLLAP